MHYELEKPIWTDSDFDDMGWHDATIYKIRVAEDLELDIDYIFKWNQPEVEGMPFTFWVAPATLVFKNIRHLKFEVDILEGYTLEIEDIERQAGEEGTVWAIITTRGDFEFMCDGYEQFIRQPPSFQFGQSISYIERSGVSLERITNLENPNILEERWVKQHKEDLEHYENAKKRQLKRNEKELLEKSRDEGSIDTKQYLLKKKELKDSLEYFDYWLKGTRFEKY
ncbi:hypothetical protein [Hufsiella ginkgonis]|uniref:Uncharacterized protein n=1 Tax=Hufsiella ginkgonis TaxID=2695274 RepID=A0A7K1XTM4_9SPHI|nr:hypothetical protein [Hufsiella ginkgonis]MXV14322.1 hypothetical protein [Hufsiella ginkgonis]